MLKSGLQPNLLCILQLGEVDRHFVLHFDSRTDDHQRIINILECLELVPDWHSPVYEIIEEERVGLEGWGWYVEQSLWYIQGENFCLQSLDCAQGLSNLLVLGHSFRKNSWIRICWRWRVNSQSNFVGHWHLGKFWYDVVIPGRYGFFGHNLSIILHILQAMSIQNFLRDILSFALMSMAMARRHKRGCKFTKAILANLREEEQGTKGCTCSINIGSVLIYKSGSGMCMGWVRWGSKLPDESYCLQKLPRVVPRELFKWPEK